MSRLFFRCAAAARFAQAKRKGVGAASAEQVRQVWRFADAAVIGSAIVNEIQTLGDSPDLVKRVGEFVRSLIAPITDQPLVEQSPRAKIR